MHLPVLLCGIILGPKYGFLVGLILPLTRFLMIGMPPLFPTAISMTFELAAYGGIIGLLYCKLSKTPVNLYISLIGAMLAERVVWAAARTVLLGVMDIPFSFELFLAEAFINAVPGIILQIVLVPIIILALKKPDGKAGCMQHNFKLIYLEFKHKQSLRATNRRLCLIALVFPTLT